MYNDSGSTAAFAALLLLLIPLLLILIVAGYVIGSFFLMKIFEKAGVQGKWRAWVPVYNSLIFAKLGDVSPWVMLGAIIAGAVLGNIPAIGFIFSLLPVAALVLAGLRVGTKLNKEWYYLLLWILGIGIYIWYGIMAFTKDRWNPAVGPAPWANSFLADKTVWDGIPVQPSAVGATPPAGYAEPGAYPPPPAGTPGAYPPPAADVPPAPPAPPTPPAPDDPAAPRA
jgi:hypothetical protein